MFHCLWTPGVSGLFNLHFGGACCTSALAGLHCVPFFDGTLEGLVVNLHLLAFIVYHLFVICTLEGHVVHLHLLAFIVRDNLHVCSLCFFDGHAVPILMAHSS